MTCFPGWTWEYIDQNMTIPRLLEITEYHKVQPPIHILIGRYFGYPKKSSELDDEGQTLFDVMQRA